MAKKKQLSIEQRARIDILAAEGFSQRSIAKNWKFQNFKIQGVDLNFWPVVYMYSIIYRYEARNTQICSHCK